MENSENRDLKPQFLKNELLKDFFALGGNYKIDSLNIAKAKMSDFLE
ncbi:MAG: hypothetical protein FWF57_08415 [Defluviitaleaceae bacterium]|nr:hypothetical protein [Defluviitaleaceae bacterium]